MFLTKVPPLDICGFMWPYWYFENLALLLRVFFGDQKRTLRTYLKEKTYNYNIKPIEIFNFY